MVARVAGIADAVAELSLDIAKENGLEVDVDGFRGAREAYFNQQISSLEGLPESTVRALGKALTNAYNTAIIHLLEHTTVDGVVVAEYQGSGR